jgi:hypothetical protein
VSFDHWVHNDRQTGKSNPARKNSTPRAFPRDASRFFDPLTGSPHVNGTGSVP